MIFLWDLLTTTVPFVFIVLMVWIILEDFRHRAVRWWLFPLAGITALGINSDNLLISGIIVNAIFVLAQIIMLTIYFSVKEKRVVNITQRYLGWGDILFWGVLCLLFSPLNFVLFFMISMLLTGMIVGIWRIIISGDMGTIPLAGMQAAVLLLVWLLMIFSGKNNFRNDGWIEQWIMA